MTLISPPPLPKDDGERDTLLLRRSAERADRAGHDAFGVLYLRYVKRWTAYVRATLWEYPGDVDDVVQNAVVRLYRARGRQPAERKFAPWSFGFMKNCARESMAHGGMAPLPEDELAPRAPGPGPATQMRIKDDRRDLQAAIARLPAVPFGPHVAWIEGEGGPVLDSGLPSDQPRDVRVELYWPLEDRPAIGAPVEVVRDDAVIARGKIDDAAREGRLAATIHVPAGVRLKRGDRVRKGS